MDTIGKIYMSLSLMEKMDLLPMESIKVRVGAKVVNSQLVTRTSGLKTYMLSPQLAKALGLKRRKPMQLRYDRENDMLHIGPTIGILASHVPNAAEFDPKSTQAELIFLSKISKTMVGQIYVFTYNSINWSNLTTRGYTYKYLTPERGIWISSIYPLPDVVYDRIGSRINEAKTKNRNIKRKLMGLPYLQYFNPSFLNKWRVHQLLTSNEDLLEYLPETKQLTVSNMKDMLQRHKILFIKPENGSLGSGIIKVNREENGRLRYVIYKHGRQPGYADDSQEFMSRTRKVRDGKPYIVQQGINLSTYKGSSFDIRIIYQKNREGEWQISKKFVRVAARGSSVANLARGGNPETSKKVLAYVFNRKKKLIEKRNAEIKELCKMVANTLEKASQKLYGELGIDIGIDKNGKPWLFEVNSKPRKTTETELSKGIIRNTFKRPLDYSVYLAGFNKKR